MLRFLRIKHLAVIDSVEVEFDPGLNVLTGETGAGKSILVEAVGLLLGGRASGDLVRTGEDTAAIEAIFESGGEELLVRREITAQGRSRAFINGALATAAALKELSNRLVELHGQHERRHAEERAVHRRLALHAEGALAPGARRRDEHRLVGAEPEECREVDGVRDRHRRSAGGEGEADFQGGGDRRAHEQYEEQAGPGERVRGVEGRDEHAGDADGRRRHAAAGQWETGHDGDWGGRR